VQYISWREGPPLALREPATNALMGTYVEPELLQGRLDHNSVDGCPLDRSRAVTAERGTRWRVCPFNGHFTLARVCLR
jgi:hypothetical protein